MKFVIFMALSGKAKSIHTYLSMGCRILCEQSNGRYTPPSQLPRLRRTIKAIERIYGKLKNRKPPITIAMLMRICSTTLLITDIYTLTIKAALLVAFFGFLRKSSYCTATMSSFDPMRDLTFSHLVKRGNRYAIVLSHTKTIQCLERQVEIWLPRYDNIFCPSLALDNMIVTRTRQWGPPQPFQPLFMITKGGQALYSARFLAELKTAVQAAGYDPKLYTPHSLRRGGATFAFECQCSPACIKMQGDWISDAYLLYLNVSDAIKEQTCALMERAIRASITRAG